MAEPRRVPLICLSPVRRREAGSPALEREPEPPPGMVAGREASLLEPPHEASRPEPPPLPPRESGARLEPPREPPRPEPQPPREPPRPEPPPPQLPPPPPRQGSRQEPPPPQEALPLRQTVRLEVVLKDPTEEGCVEFSYPELLLCGDSRVRDPPEARGPFPEARPLPAPSCRGGGRRRRGKSGGLAVPPASSWPEGEGEAAPRGSWAPAWSWRARPVPLVPGPLPLARFLPCVRCAWEGLFQFCFAANGMELLRCRAVYFRFSVGSGQVNVELVVWLRCEPRGAVKCALSSPGDEFLQSEEGAGVIQSCCWHCNLTCNCQKLHSKRNYFPFSSQTENASYSSCFVF